MGNLKQRLIKPGTSFNYAEGVKVLASEAINADQLVYVSASSGPFLTASVADADSLGKADGRLMIAKHAIPINGYGVVLPWKLVTSLDTSASAVGTKVYLSSTPGTAVGANLTVTCPTGGYQVEVGVVTVSATIANGGAMFINAADAERFKGGAVAVGASQRPAETFTFVVPFGNTTTDNTLTAMPFPILLLDAHIVCGNGQAVGMIVKDNADANCLTCPNTAASAGALSRATAYIVAAADIAAGQTMKLTRAGTPHASDYAIITAIRA